MNADAPRWTAADLVTLGYFAIRPRAALWCSPSGCRSEQPRDWAMHGLLNAAWLFDTIDLVDAVLAREERARWLRIALRGLPEQIGAHRDGWPLEWKAREVRPAPIPSRWVRLGYDVCSRYAQSTLECSPLTCNGYEQELGANRFGLFRSFDLALAAAHRFAAEGVAEPGPYVVLEVWAEHDPTP